MEAYKESVKASITNYLNSKATKYKDKELNSYRDRLYTQLISNFSSIIGLVQVNLFRSIDINTLYAYSKTFNLYLPRLNEFEDIYLKCINDSLEKGKKEGEEGYISFSDMLWLFCLNLNRITISKKDYVLVDECQDLNKAMIKIVQAFYDEGARILMVGDPNQAIQGFAGADEYCWKLLEEKFNPKILPLYKSFRCPKLHVELANDLVPHMTTNVQEEGVLKTVDFDTCIEDSKKGDVILSRNKASLIKTYFSLLANNKASFIKDSSSLVRTLTGYLAMAFPIGDESIPLNNIGKNITKVMQVYIDGLPENQSEYLEDTKKCLLLFNKYIVENNKDIKFISFKKYSTLLRKTIEDYNSNGIQLSTIHSYKGCEADRVWLLNYSQLPLISSSMLDWQLEQEYNLLFVALTRSKHTLYLIN